jgi:hypothetical protein
MFFQNKPFARHSKQAVISTMLCLSKERLSWTITALPVQQGKIQPEYAP